MNFKYLKKSKGETYDYGGTNMQQRTGNLLFTSQPFPGLSLKHRCWYPLLAFIK